MTTLEAYLLRMRLVERGHVPCPLRDGQPVEIPWNMPSESCVRGWSNRYEYATETGIVDLQTRSVTPVVEVPASQAELLAMKQVRARTYNQKYKAARRRREGRPLREDWLASHSTARNKPWLAAPIHPDNRELQPLKQHE